LGCCAYWCLTGNEPFAGASTRSLMAAHANEVPPAPSLHVDIPSEFDDLILACLSKRASDRPSATELVVALEELGRRFPWTREDAARWWGAQTNIERDDASEPHALTLPARESG
jgi:serine/threonine protein kinase